MESTSVRTLSTVICPKMFQPFASLTLHFPFKYPISHFTNKSHTSHSFIVSRCENFQGTIPEGIAPKFLVSKAECFGRGGLYLYEAGNKLLVRFFVLSSLSVSLFPFLELKSEKQESCQRNTCFFEIGMIIGIF